LSWKPFLSDNSATNRINSVWTLSVRSHWFSFPVKWLHVWIEPKNTCCDVCAREMGSSWQTQWLFIWSHPNPFSCPSPSLVISIPDNQVKAAENRKSSQGHCHGGYLNMFKGNLKFIIPSSSNILLFSTEHECICLLSTLFCLVWWRKESTIDLKTSTEYLLSTRTRRDLAIKDF
jgi:hypothetical protein